MLVVVTGPSHLAWDRFRLFLRVLLAPLNTQAHLRLAPHPLEMRVWQGAWCPAREVSSQARLYNGPLRRHNRHLHSLLLRW